jgi:two-component system, NtrC family, sensor kinase
MAGEPRNNGKNVDVASLNEGLLLGLVRQHELTEAAEVLNAQLQAEIVARKKVEGALVNSEKLASVGRMAAVLAHEINNPLAAVTNVLYLAQSIEGLPESARQYLEMADGELKRIAHITRQTLGFYRETSAPTTFAVAASLDSVIDLLKGKKVSKLAVIEQQCDRTLLVTAFEGELRQVLSNLVMNSLDAIAERGKITLRAAVSPGFRDGRRAVRITVADDGQGMSRTSLSQIFQPFFTTKGSIGNGLGLWVSKQIIEKHGGCIQVHSRTNGPQHGTTFSVLLPWEAVLVSHIAQSNSHHGKM